MSAVVVFVVVVVVVVVVLLLLFFSVLCVLFVQLATSSANTIFSRSKN